MTIHRSLRTKGKLARHRNVLSRAERLQVLAGQGRWQETQSIFSLPKVRNIKVRAKKKVKKADAAAEGAAAPGATPEQAAAPAGTAAPAKGAAPAKPGAPAKGKEEKKK